MNGPVRVTLLPDPHAAPVGAAGPVQSVQEAEVTLPPELLEEIWRPEYLERLARAYWAHLNRVSRGLVRVAYAPDSRTVLIAGIPLLRFRRPDYVTGPGLGRVTWRIERGLLVAPSGRGQGFLRIGVRRLENANGDPAVRIRAEVANYYPFIRGSGWFARLGSRLYSATQLRFHVWIVHGFLRSLERLDLPPSDVGALADEPS
jgi:hypothetical protein